MTGWPPALRARAECPRPHGPLEEQAGQRLTDFRVIEKGALKVAVALERVRGMCPVLLMATPNSYLHNQHRRISQNCLLLGSVDIVPSHLHPWIEQAVGEG